MWVVEARDVGGSNGESGWWRCVMCVEVMVKVGGGGT